MPAQAFGDLGWYIGGYPLDQLAECMFSKERFATPTVSSAATIEALVRDILTGTPWPYRRDDFHAFVEAVIACVPPHSIALEYAFRRAAALYSTRLGP